MNMKSIFNFTVEVIDLLANWLNSNSKEWAWCPIKVDNRTDRF